MSGTSVTRSGELAHWDGLGGSPAARPARGGRLALDYASAPATAVPLPSHPNPFKAYSKDWWDIEERNAKIEDARLARLMVICKGCILDRNLIPEIRREAVAEAAPSSHLAPLDADGTVRPSGEK